MRTTRLGTAGPTISRLGIGGWQAGGSGPWGAGPRSDDDEAVAAIRRAVEGGVRWVDTAASYGLGHSEEMIRRALEPWRIGDDVLVFTKCGHPWDPPDRIRTDLSADSIRRECDGSLRRLGVDRIDLYQFHHHDPSTPIEESWGVMAELVRVGKVGCAGVSNVGVDLLERCEAVRHVDVVQPELSMLRRQACRDVIPWADRHGIGVIVYSPLASGILTDAFDATRLHSLGDAEWRRLDADRLFEATAALRRVANRVGFTLCRLAVAWALAVNGVSGAICGARTPQQVDGWIAAADDDVDETTRADIEKILRRIEPSDSRS
jgi:aryl-alcohol dehydrogenase-like predicted oxidoreductase